MRRPPLASVLLLPPLRILCGGLSLGTMRYSYSAPTGPVRWYLLAIGAIALLLLRHSNNAGEAAVVSRWLKLYPTAAVPESDTEVLGIGRHGATVIFLQCVPSLPRLESFGAKLTSSLICSGLGGSAAAACVMGQYRGCDLAGPTYSRPSQVSAR